MLFLRQKIVVNPLVLILLLGLILIFIYGLIEQNYIRISWVDSTRRKLLLYEGGVVDLFQEKKLEQTFTANYPGLAQIDILFGGNNTASRPKILFHLKNTCDSEDDIIFISTELSQSNDLEFQSFSFPALDNSTGRFYCIVLEAPEATAESAVRLQLSTGDLYPYGELRVRSPEKAKDLLEISESPKVSDNDLLYEIYLPIVMNGPHEKGIRVEDIGFRLHYKGLLRPTAQVFITRLTANKPYILRKSWFYGGLVIIYVILLIALFYLARRTIQFDQKQ